MLTESGVLKATRFHDITLAIPTVGRIEMLCDCLASIATGSSLPKEILLADQSSEEQVQSLSQKYKDLPIRVEQCHGKGIARNMNLILESASYDHIAVTHDDCIVGSHWLDKCVVALSTNPEAIFTGRVLAGGDDPLAVPSTKNSRIPHDFTGTLAHGALYPNNMVVYRPFALGIGGFDQRQGFLTAAEDLDFSYRWLKSGKTLMYEPEMVVTHNDWRAPEQLVGLYKHYARCAGRYYGKHMAAGDFVPIKQGVKDIYNGLKAWKRKINNGTPRWQDERLELPLWVPVGVAEGIWESLMCSNESNC